MAKRKEYLKYTFNLLVYMCIFNCKVIVTLTFISFMGHKMFL